jgi:hypothetical protein
LLMVGVDRDVWTSVQHSTRRIESLSDGKEVLVADRISFVRASELARVVCNRNIILYESSATLKVAGITLVVKLVVVVGIL